MIMPEMVHHARIIPLLIQKKAYPNGPVIQLRFGERVNSDYYTQDFYPDYGWRNTSPQMKIEDV
ncbi:MAG: hypothetical protein CM1200mP40_25160 [Gammaproteobacteria bacterium]|nr:MAG: hypothetical protein CM1200mP40_25160 [Gammaproteobacteria bacterium]